VCKCVLVCPHRVFIATSPFVRSRTTRTSLLSQHTRDAISIIFKHAEGQMLICVSWNVWCRDGVRIVVRLRLNGYSPDACVWQAWRCLFTNFLQVMSRKSLDEAVWKTKNNEKVQSPQVTKRATGELFV
jgi:hypothetical protein